MQEARPSDQNRRFKLNANLEEGKEEQSVRASWTGHQSPGNSKI